MLPKKLPVGTHTFTGSPSSSLPVPQQIAVGGDIVDDLGSTRPQLMEWQRTGSIPPGQLLRNYSSEKSRFTGLGVIKLPPPTGPTLPPPG